MKHLIVDQEVGGSIPPSCTILPRLDRSWQKYTPHFKKNVFLNEGFRFSPNYCRVIKSVA